nr:hypothetical protein [Tanacetum cinerariifolium]
MSNISNTMQTQTSNTLHNAIIEAGSKDRPPMLAPGNYVQWKSRIKRYIDTKPNQELIHYCLKNPPYELGWKEKFVLDSEGNPTTITEKIWDNKDVHDLGSVGNEFPAIAFNDMLTSEATLSYEPTDNDKVNMPLLPLPEHSDSCFDDLDFFKDFENEFPAIVYNGAPTSKSNLLAEPTLCTQHIDEFDLKEETSLSEYDKEEQNVLNFN